jgi:hypothetical protein
VHVTVIAEDLADGFVTEEHAKREYGWGGAERG